MSKMVIQELRTGKCHYRALKHNCSIRYGVEGHKLVVRDYYTGAKLQAFDVAKYGSIRYWVEGD